MLYNLGHMNILSPFLFKLGFIAAILASVLFFCVVMSIAVRIGNFILGF